MPNIPTYLPLMVFLVQECPRNRTDWLKASERLNCSIDTPDNTNLYHCVPSQDRSSLLEFCFIHKRIGVQEGNCLALTKSRRLNPINCSDFHNGCPTSFYFSNKVYKYPACLEVDIHQRCFLSQKNCQATLQNTTNKIQSNKTVSTEVPGIGKDGLESGKILLIGITSGLYVLILAAFICYLYRRKALSSEVQSVENEETNPETVSLLSHSQRATSLLRPDSSQKELIYKRIEEDEPTILTSKPGKPFVQEVSSNAIRVTWSEPACTVEYYHIRYKAISNEKGKWMTKETNDNSTSFQIEGLQNSTLYIFKIQAIQGDDVGPFGPQSDEIRTKEPLAGKLLKNAQVTGKYDTSPVVYKLQTSEVPHSRDEVAMTKRLYVGPTSDTFVVDEKTILIVGSTGSGKTTLVDGLLNYISGVNFEDNFRFSMIELEENEKKTHDQALSQTEWITVYTIGPLEGGRIPFRLNIIDTPGFGNTRGIEQDNKILEHIRELFSAQGPCSVDTLDAVCFIVKAPDARLTPTQTYTFSSILSIFGHDIGPNICALITFADGKDPVVLESLRKANVPFGDWFPFNNSALFADNLNLVESSFTHMFWQMGIKSFDRFFDHIKKLKPKSLKLTQDVLQKRKNLLDLLFDIRPKINASLLKIDQLKREIDIFKENEEAIKASKNFTYMAEESKIIAERLPQGTYVTNCIICNTTCHSNCDIPDDDQKRGCSAMDSNGYCTVCSKKCYWDLHRNHPFKYVVVVEKVEKSYDDIKKKYQTACKKKLAVEDVIQKLGMEEVEEFEYTNEMMKRMKDIKNKLQEIDLRPDPLTAVDHIDLMIRAEEMEKKYGFERRIEVLKKFREFACTEDKFDELRTSMQNFKDDLMKLGRKNSFIAKLFDVEISSSSLPSSPKQSF